MTEDRLTQESTRIFRELQDLSRDTLGAEGILIAVARQLAIMSDRVALAVELSRCVEKKIDAMHNDFCNLEKRVRILESVVAGLEPEDPDPPLVIPDITPLDPEGLI